MYVQVLTWVLGVGCLLAVHAEQFEDIPTEQALKIADQITHSRRGLTLLRKSIDDIYSDIKDTHQHGDLDRKRKTLEIVQRILQEMDADLIHEKKRTCRVNLGGHCATESAAAVADQWHYLSSPLSPGRKRRDTALYKKLIAGKLFH